MRAFQFDDFANPANPRCLADCIQGKMITVSPTTLPMTLTEPCNSQSRFRSALQRHVLDPMFGFSYNAI